jgi:hypothetical protein
MSNRARAEDIWRLLGHGDVSGMLDLFADDVEFDGRFGPETPWYGLSKGKQELLRFWELMGAALSETSYEIYHVMEEGDVTLSRGHESFTVTSTNIRVEFPVVAEHHWENGKIVFWREY